MNQESEEDRRALIFKLQADNLMEMVKEALVPCIAIKRGMQDAPFGLEEMTAMELNTALQGSVSLDVLLAQLTFKRGISEEKGAWVTNWIKSLSQDDRQRFLIAMTGVGSLGNKSLCVEPGPSIKFNTCTYSLWIPFKIIDSEELMHSLLNTALKEKETFTAV